MPEVHGQEPRLITNLTGNQNLTELPTYKSDYHHMKVIFTSRDTDDTDTISKGFTAVFNEGTLLLTFLTA